MTHDSAYPVHPPATRAPSSPTTSRTTTRTPARRATAPAGHALPLAGTGLATVLDELRALDEPVLFHPVPGNAGDSAINCSTYRLLAQSGVRWQRVDADVDPAQSRGRVLVCGGGGNLVPMYDDVRRLLQRHHRDCRQLVLLPATIRGHEDLLATLGAQVTLLCRDPVSLAHARAAAPQARVLASHDVVLHLDVRALMAEARWRFLPWVSSPDQARRNLRRRWRGWRYDRAGAAHRGELMAFRTDVEQAPGRARPADAANFDASVEFVSDDMSPRLTLEATWRLLRFLDRYATVHTDRLHVAILSALLGKTVRLHDNSYGKNAAVHAQSLREHFPHVELVAPGEAV